ncbi:hypothetical protein [Sorangium sp. So ce426]|uniref:hypothetical protein n=1 Tax=Sorangium sp. So ce426 TaxID=3133312 RepID=UPI003F5B5667
MMLGEALPSNPGIGVMVDNPSFEAPRLGPAAREAVAVGHDMALAPGSLLIMRASVQEGCLHAVLAVEAAGPRISLTFRFLSR